ncbi:hypothetical protein KR026_010068, partial [Drosophila bipectinata]
SIVQTEVKKIDEALRICNSMESEIEDCLKNVEEMNETYNAPGRYSIDMEVFRKDYPRALSPAVTTPEVQSMQSVSLEKDTVGETVNEARTAQELDESYVEVRYKFIKLKRELEATVAHCQRVVDHSVRQKKVTHIMLWGSENSKTRVCHH